MIRPLLRRVTVTLFVVSALTGLAGEAPAQSPDDAPRAAAPSRFLGRWQLDLSRMPATYGPPPERVVYRFEQVAGGEWRTTVDITGRDHSVRHMAVRYRPDGTAARGEGETSEADSAAILLPAPNVLVMNLARNKMPASVRVYTLSADGKEMTEAAADLDGSGEPFIRTFRFKRLD